MATYRTRTVERKAYGLGNKAWFLFPLLVLILSAANVLLNVAVFKTGYGPETWIAALLGLCSVFCSAWLTSFSGKEKAEGARSIAFYGELLGTISILIGIGITFGAHKTFSLLAQTQAETQQVQTHTEDQAQQERGRYDSDIARYDECKKGWDGRGARYRMAYPLASLCGEVPSRPASVAGVENGVKQILTYKVWGEIVIGVLNIATSFTELLIFVVALAFAYRALGRVVKRSNRQTRQLGGTRTSRPDPVHVPDSGYQM